MPADAPELIAHRGFAGAYPENTVAAAAGAAAAADAIEIDVVPTADGDVVAFHDSRLGERDSGKPGLTDATGVVWETDTETVTSARVLGTDETVPLLADVLAAIPADVRVNVELKNPGSFDVGFSAALTGTDVASQADVWRPFVEDALAVADRFDHEVLFSAFYEPALKAVHEASDYPVAPLVWHSVDTGLDVAERYDAAAIHPPVDAIQGTPFHVEPEDTWLRGDTETDVLAAAHEAGRDVHVYTVETWYEASQLAAAGVDGVIADYPGVLEFVRGDG